MSGLNKTLLRSKIIRIGIVLLALVMLQFGGIVYQVLATPGVIRNPKLEHYHFRMQVIVDGRAENFSQEQYQEAYAKDQCSTDLPDHPIHFHDQKDQIVHIHWEGITGGMVMKYYGWNYIGGPSNTLGYRLTGTRITQVPIHGKVLPSVPKRDQVYIYSGSENGYKERSFVDWQKKDLEAFFGVTSNFPAHKTNTSKQGALLQSLFPKASAHGTATDADGDDGMETEGERLTRINNLLGNVVIFVQKEKPTDQQVKERFNHLEPLSDSTCGG